MREGKSLVLSGNDAVRHGRAATRVRARERAAGAVVAALVLSAAVSDAAASVYDGLWTGGGRVETGNCDAFDIVVSVVDSKVTGKVIVPPEDEFKIQGEVSPGGEFRGRLTYLWFTVAQLQGWLGAERAEGRWRTVSGLECTGVFAVEKN